MEGSGGSPDPFAAALTEPETKSHLTARRCSCRSRVLGQMQVPGSWVCFLPLGVGLDEVGTRAHSGLVNALDPVDVAGSGGQFGVGEGRVNATRFVDVDL